MDVVLLAGLWLPVSAWSAVASQLEGLGHRALPVALPGVDDGSVSATLDDQLNAALAVVDGADRPLVVGHSAACTLAWMVADHRVDKAAGVAMIGGFPSSDGDTYAEFFPLADGVMPFPGWEPFEGPDADDLDDGQRADLAAAAIAVPQGVAGATVTFTDGRRHSLPVTLICPEFDPDQARSWIDDGAVPELAAVSNLELVDIDSGHWPMITQPAKLARLLALAGTKMSSPT